MAGIYLQEFSWHDGETKVQHDMHVPPMDNPTFPALSPQLANHLQIAPLIAIGTLDEHRQPWTTLWGNGDKGFARPVGQGIIGIRTPVTGKYDPVVESLFGKEPNGEVVREEGDGRMVAGLTIDLETRKRVKMYGRMIAGAFGLREDEATDHQEHVAEVQLVLKIEQSLGNCPKYLNKKHIVAAEARPELVSNSIQLSQRAVELLEKSDLFFISSSQANKDMDTNHRGGPQGFVRVLSNDESGAVIVYPEYSGNRLYQTLGNLSTTPLAGLCFPDFETGDMLYVTGKTEILIGQDAAAVLPRSNLAVKIKLTASRYVSNALPFRGIEGERSPYNPTVRYLPTEKKPTTIKDDAPLQQATLLRQIKLTPTISRFRFSLENAASYKPGQYVTLDLSKNLYYGYQHMADDDPQSINDDYVRTFTVSSLPGTPPDPVKRLKDDEFEITIRKVGVVTDYLCKHMGKESRERGMHELEVAVKGFGGEFEVQQDGDETIAFIAAGVGITPILPSLWSLDCSRLRLFWSVRKADIGMVKDTLEQHPGLEKAMTVFVTDAVDDDQLDLDGSDVGLNVLRRRLSKEDLELGGISKVYLCTPPPMRKVLISWLPGKDLIFEDFNF
jgi:NAD(P)H-flavin reductase